MASVAELFVNIRGDVTGFTGALKTAEKSVEGLTGKLNGTAKSVRDSDFGKLGKTVGLGIAAGVGVAALAIGDFTKKAFESQQIVKQLDAVLRSTAGAAGVTRDAALDLSKSLERVTNFDDETVLSVENLLLTFTKIGKDVFPQATETVLDMATALGEDTKSAAIQLGKALQDPTVGLTALRRVGVAFSDSQVDVIKNLYETGHAAEAQTLILKELGTEFGNSARAAASPMQQLKNALNDIEESIGSAFLPLVQRAANALNDFLADHQEDIDNLANILATRIPQALDIIGNAFSTVGDAVRPFFDLFDQKDKIIILSALAGVIGGALTAALLTFAAASLLAFATNPITLWLAAIAGIVVAITIVARHWDAIWSHLQEAPKAIANWLRDNWLDFVLAIFTGPLGLIVHHWAAIWGAFGPIVAIAMNGVIEVVNSAINGILGGFERLINGIGAGIQKIRDSVSDIPGARSSLDAIGLSATAADAFKNFSAGSVSIPGVPGGSIDFSGITDKFSGLADGVQALGDVSIGALPSVEDLTGGIGDGSGVGGGGGLTGAAAQADQGLQNLAAAFDAFHEATGGSVTDFLALIKVSQDKAELDKRQGEALINLKAAQIEAADGAFQLREGLVAIAEKAVELGGSLPRAIQQALQGVADNIRNAFNGLFNRPTKEGAQLDLEIALKEEELARRKAAGASDDETKRIEDQIDSLRRRKDVLDRHADVLKAQIDVADQTNLTEQQRDFAAQLYTIALHDSTAQLNDVNALVNLQALAQQHYIGALNDAANTLGSPVSASDPFTAAEKHWINGVARSRGEPEPFPGYFAGIDYVPRDMIVRVHKGERIQSEAEVQAQKSSTVTTNPRQRTGSIYIDNLYVTGDPEAALAGMGLGF